MDDVSITDCIFRVHTGFFLEEGNVDVCKGCMRELVHPLDFNKILGIFKDKKCQIQL